MTDDDKPAQKWRAEDLRKEIDQALRTEPGARHPRSPREFIEEQMRKRARKQGNEEEEDEPNG